MEVFFEPIENIISLLLAGLFISELKNLIGPFRL